MKEGANGAVYRINGRPIGDGHYQLRLEDVTSSHEMDAVMRQQRAELVELMDQAPIGFFAADEHGVLRFANATFAEWLGFGVASLTNGQVCLHGLLADPPRGAQPFDIVAAGGETQRREAELVGAGGKRILAELLQTVRRQDDASVRTRAIVRNLSHDRDWQAALRQSEQRFQRFFSQAPVGIALIDGENRVTEFNEALAGMLDGLEGQADGRPISDLLTAESVARLGEFLQEARRQAAPPPIEVSLKGAGGREAQLFARPLSAGKAGGDDLMLHFIDMSERRDLERQFAQSQKMQAVGQLAGGVAHDFNNLLTAMLGFCDLLLLRHTPGDPSFSDIMQIKHNANRASNLVRQLLAFSRQQTLQPKILDVTDALSDLSHLLRRLIGSNIDLEISHGRDLGLVKVDPNQLDQVIINLVVNARDAMASGGRLVITTERFANSSSVKRDDEEMPPGQWIAIAVSDTGSGIPPELHTRIFEPFFSTKEVGQGTGLGLSTVYGIIRQTGGYIFLDSEIGHGSTFTIYLPVAEDAAPGEPVGESAEPVQDITGFGTILLVEDEDAVRMFSARALQNIGYRVIEADSGENALAQIEADPNLVFDLIITDVVMPNMDGPSLVDAVRAKQPAQRVLYISGYTEDKVREQVGTQDEQTYFLSKPFSLKQLAGRVKEVIRS